MSPFFTLSGTKCFSCLEGGTPIAGSLVYACPLLGPHGGRWTQELVAGPHVASVMTG